MTIIFAPRAVIITNIVEWPFFSHSPDIQEGVTH